MAISIMRLLIMLSMLACSGCANGYSPPGSNGNLNITLNNTVSNTTVVH